jgi:hypothetical protein
MLICNAGLWGSVVMTMNGHSTGAWATHRGESESKEKEEKNEAPQVGEQKDESETSTWTSHDVHSPMRRRADLWRPRPKNSTLASATGEPVSDCNVSFCAASRTVGVCMVEPTHNTIRQHRGTLATGAHSTSPRMPVDFPAPLSFLASSP